MFRRAFHAESIYRRAIEAIAHKGLVAAKTCGSGCFRKKVVHLATNLCIALAPR